MITAIFEVPGMTAQQYDTIMERLAAAGEASPAGRLVHTAAATDDGWQVVDVWASGEQLNAFAGGYLAPILVDVLGSVPEPTLRPTHSLVAA